MMGGIGCVIGRRSRVIGAMTGSVRRVGVSGVSVARGRVGMISRSVVVGAVAIDGMAFTTMIIGGVFCRVGTMGHSGLGAVSGRRTMITLFAMMAAGHDGRLATEHLAHSDVEQEDGSGV